jgi:hypothetical protein
MLQCVNYCGNFPLEITKKEMVNSISIAVDTEIAKNPYYSKLFWIGELLFIQKKSKGRRLILQLLTI